MATLLKIVSIILPAAMVLCSSSHAQLRRSDPPPQNVVPCWAVPNGVNSTIQCANGYWRTITPEGEEIVGMGVTDPNGSAVGGNFVINPGTGGPNINITQGPLVRPPYQAPVTGPGQAEAFGNQPRYD